MRSGSRAFAQPRVLADAVAIGGRGSKIRPARPGGDRIRALVHPAGGSALVVHESDPGRFDAAAAVARLRLPPSLSDNFHRNFDGHHVPALQRLASPCFVIS